MSLETEIREAFERHATDARPGADVWARVERRIERSHRWRGIASVVGAAIAITVAAVAAPRLGSQAPPVGPGPGPLVPNLKVVAMIAEIGGRLAVGEDAIWALAGDLVRIDPKRNAVVTRIDLIGLAPKALAVGEGAVWITNSRGCSSLVSCDPQAAPLPEPFPQQNSVMRVDLNTNRIVSSIRVEDPQDVAVGFGAVWVTAANESDLGSTLVRIDPVSNRVVARVELGVKTVAFAHVTTGEGAVWVSASPGGLNPNVQTTVYKIDPITNRIVPPVTVLATAGELAPLAAGEGGVWVARPLPRSPSGLARIDPQTGVVVGTVVLPDAAPERLRDITIGAGYVWAVSGGGNVWSVDPRVDALVGKPLLIGDPAPVHPIELVYGFGSLWVSAGEGGSIWRLQP